MKTIITFDYEMFLGPCPGSVEKCLIEPTERYLNLARILNIRYVFFVDVLYLIKLKEFSVSYKELECSFSSIVTQLRQASEEGHDIELHLHPQWFYSNYNHDGWQMDFVHYKLLDCSLQDIAIMISSGCKLIEDICGVRPIAYRAGGYSFPNSPEILHLLNKEGIRYDSSVLLGFSKQGTFQEYNYSEIKEFRYYNFMDNNAIENKDGIFTEFPVTCALIPELYCSFKLRLYLSIHRECIQICGDGKGIGVLSKDVPQQRNIFSKLFGERRVKASLDFINAYYLDDLYNIVCKRKGSLFVIIGHPKNATAHSYIMLQKFILKRIDCDIITFRDIK